MSVKITLKMTDQFFDRRAIQASVRRAGRDWRRLGQAGAFVRRTARTSMRKVKKRTTFSQPGQPPRAHAPDEFNIRKILYIWDPFSQSMIVGPVGGGKKMGRYTVPELHEEGGTVSAQSLSAGERRWLARLRREATKGRKRGRRGPQRRNTRGQFTSSKARSKRQAIAFIRKVAAGQLPNRDPEPTGALVYEPRPFMLPALKREAPKFPELWEGSVHP